jgi:hypothetical protein
LPVQLGTLLLTRDPSEVACIAEHWDSWCTRESRYVPSLDEIQCAIAKADEFAFFVGANRSATGPLACFISEPAKIFFAAGRKSFGSIKIKQLTLVGGVVLGRLQPETWLRIMRALDEMFDYDFLNLGDIPIESDLWRAAAALPSDYRVRNLSKANNVHWLIKLPKTFEDYISALGHHSRQTIRQSLRKFEACTENSFSVYSEKHELEEFLRLAEDISSRTYQWALGQKVCNDSSTRDEYQRLAEAGNLKCYILGIGGTPCAFIRGTLAAGVFNYQTPGFLPEYAKWSPGTVGLMLVIKDLIETSSCRVFDFGEGGGQAGYKSRFANDSFLSGRMMISHRRAFRATMVTVLLDAFVGAKGLARRFLDKRRA